MSKETIANQSNNPFGFADDMSIIARSKTELKNGFLEIQQTALLMRHEVIEAETKYIAVKNGAQ